MRLQNQLTKSQRKFMELRRKYVNDTLCDIVLAADIDSTDRLEELDDPQKMVWLFRVAAESGTIEPYDFFIVDAKEDIYELLSMPDISRFKSTKRDFPIGEYWFCKSEDLTKSDFHVLGLARSFDNTRSCVVYTGQYIHPCFGYHPDIGVLEPDKSDSGIVYILRKDSFFHEIKYLGGCNYKGPNIRFLRRGN